MRWLSLLALVLATSATAAEFRRGEEIVIPKDTIVADDLYAFGSKVRIEGEVRGDVVAFASAIQVPGRIQGDLVGAGTDIQITGAIGGSIRVAATTLALEGRVARDAIVAANAVQVRPNAALGGDLIAAGDSIVVQAPIGRTARIAARAFDLQAPVRGDLHLRAETLNIADRGEIAGTLSYATRQATISPQAKIGTAVREPSPRRLPPVAAFLVGWLRLAVGLFALGLLLRLIAPHWAGEALGTLRRSPGRSAASGALTLIAVPMAAVILFAIGALVGGWWIGFLGLLMLGIAIALSFALVGLWVGEWLVRRLAGGRAQLVLSLVVGAILLALMLRVPVLGGLVSLATILFGLGALLLGGWHLRLRPST